MTNAGGAKSPVNDVYAGIETSKNNPIESYDDNLMLLWVQNDAYEGERFFLAKKRQHS